MKNALFIDSTNKIVQEVEIDGYEDIRKTVGGWIEVATRFKNEDVIYVNEEGLLNVTEETGFFTVEGGHQPYAGHGLLVGTKEGTEGEDGDCKTTLEELKAKVKFLSREDI